MRAALPQHLALARAQVGATLEQAVARGQRAESFEFEQQVGCARAAAGPEFEDVAAADAGQDRCHRPREAAGE